MHHDQGKSDLQSRDPRRSLEIAVLETVLYSDLFEYALTRAEVAHYLIGVESDIEKIRACLEQPHYLNGHLKQIDGHVVARRREALVDLRRARTAPSSRLWRRARRFTRVLAAMPFVRMVAVTGALAMDNSAEGDDIDILIVARRGRVWTARLLGVMVVVAGKAFGDTLCPNYVISEDALAIETRDVFTAHEFAQMVPLHGLDVYERMRLANAWVLSYLPNARRPFRIEREIRSGPLGRAIRGIGEWVLGGRLGDALEEWEMRRKQRKFAPQVTPESNALLDRDHVKGHFNDYGLPVRRLFAERLAQFADVRGETVS